MSGGRVGSGRRLAVVAIGLLAMPFVAVLVLRVGRPVTFVQDLAVISLRARDAAAGHLPLVGPWSRQGFAHPGPLFYWLLGIPSFLTGGAYWSLIAGSAVLHAIAIAATGAVAWRRGRLALTLLVATAIGACYLAMDPWGLIAPWNIWIAYPYFLLFLLLSWSVAIGDVRLLPWLALVGTFLVQTHLGYAPLVAVAAVWSVVRLGLLARRRSLGRVRGPLLATLAVTFVLWVPVVVDQLFVSNNISAVGHYLLNTGESSAGFGAAGGWYAALFRPVPAWLGGPRRLALFTAWAEPASLWWLLVPTAVLVVGWWALRRRPDPERRALIELATFTPAVGLVAMAGITGDRFEYLFAWRTPIVAFLGIAATWAVLPSVPRALRVRRLLVACGLTAIVAATTVLTIRVIRFPAELGPNEPAVAALVDHAEREAPGGPLWVRAVGGEGIGVAATVVDRLDRRGVSVHVDAGREFEYGPERSVAIRSGDRLWLVAESGQLAARLARIPGVRIVASTDPLSRADRTRLDRLQLAMGRRLRARHLDRYIPLLDSPSFAFSVAGERGLDHRAADAISELNRRVVAHVPCRCTVLGTKLDRRIRRALDAVDAGRR